MAVTTGIYAAFISGKDGEGLVMFLISGGKITGVDSGQVRFDGTYLITPNGSLQGRVTVTAPPNGNLIQGVETGPNGLSYEADFGIPADFENVQFTRIETPMGPVNARFVKLREM
jgi:hypothetical protein